MTKSTFDAAYFDRFYESRSSRVYGKTQVSHLARGVSEMVAWFGGEIRSVLDVGAGTGLWRDWFARHKPNVSYLSTDVSVYACEKYGHELRDVTRWRGDASPARSRKAPSGGKPRPRPTSFDLIVCQGVLPYLTDADCERAIRNMARLSAGFLYLEAITARDLRTLCDRSKTDLQVKSRSAASYRRMLTKHFDSLGCGLHYIKGGPLGFYELERA